MEELIRRLIALAIPREILRPMSPLFARLMAELPAGFPARFIREPMAEPIHGLMAEPTAQLVPELLVRLLVESLCPRYHQKMWKKERRRLAFCVSKERARARERKTPP